MRHISFGSALREARIAKGLDYDTVARRLRIRPDILQAIEDGDFERMPPKGYATNMINAYARFLGLNPSDVTHMYLDEVYAYQIGRAHEDVAQNRYLHRNTSAATYRSGSSANRFQADSYGETPIYGTATSRGRRNGGVARQGRMMVEHDEMDFQQQPQRRATQQNTTGSRTSSPEQQVHPSRRSAMTDGQYLNVYANPQQQGFDWRSKLPFIIGGVIVLILIIVICNMAFCSHQDTEEKIPVTGVSSSQEATGEGETQQPVVTEQPPTDFTLSYEVASGKEVYIEVYVDGKAQIANDVTGPSSNSFTSSDTIRFVCTDPDAVTVKVNDEAQTLTASSRGIVNVTYKFSEILDQWYADHPDVPKPNSGSTSTKDASSSGSTKSGTSGSGTSGSGSSGSSGSGSSSQSN